MRRRLGIVHLRAPLIGHRTVLDMQHHRLYRSPSLANRIAALSANPQPETLTADGTEHTHGFAVVAECDTIVSNLRFESDYTLPHGNPEATHLAAIDVSPGPGVPGLGGDEPIGAGGGSTHPDTGDEGR